MNDNKVYFVGSGPGDAKLITVKGKELLENADTVIYAGSLVNPEILDYSNGEMMDSYGMTLDEITSKIVDDVKSDKMVVRLHSGDPSLYGSILEQIDELKKHDIDVEIVPGVSSVFASASSLKTQMTLNGVSDSLIITRPAGKTLDEDKINELSKHHETMAIFLGTQKIDQIMEKVDYPSDTPVAVIYHASWDDEKVIKGTVSDISQKVKDAGIKRSAMIIIGGVVDPIEFRRSYLYGVPQEPL